MYWIAIASVLLLLALGVRALRIRQPARDNAVKNYCGPSDALVDTILPEEIFEHVLSFSDPLTLVRCHFVNKYWNYQASKRQIQKLMLERAVNNVRSLPEVKAQDIEERKWLSYPPNYRIELRLSDFALAQKHDRHLLELLSDAYKKFTQNPTSYMLKTVGILSTYPTFKLPGGSVVKVKNSEAFESKIHDKSPVSSWEGEYELILPLEQCTTRNSDLLMCRTVNTIEYLCGIFPLDGSRNLRAFILAVPLIAHDILYASPFMKFLNRWFGIAAFLLLASAIFQTNFNMRRGNAPQINKTWARLNSATALITLFGFIALWPHSADHFAFVALIIATFFYGVLVSNQFLARVEDKTTKRTSIQFSNRRMAPLFALILALALSIIDYSLVYQSFLDGTLFHRLSWNTLHYVLLTVYCIWNNAMLVGYYEQPPGSGFKLRHLIAWDRLGVKMVLYTYIATIYATLCAPYWGYDIELHPIL